MFRSLRLASLTAHTSNIHRFLPPAHVGRRWNHTHTDLVAPKRSWTYRIFRGGSIFALIVGGVVFVDYTLNASAIGRNVRTFWTCLDIAIDYKLNFRPGKTEEIPALHQRVADKLYNLLTSNGGLYIKIGQAIGNNAALLPRPMQEKFAKLFDDAPQVPYSVVRGVLKAEYGREPAGPDGIFEIFEEQAVASASIAQVHRAKLKSSKGDGEWVAVKVQKPAVSKQVEWDLAAYRAVLWMYEKWFFDMPVYFLVDFITDHLRRELDFKLELQNSVQTAKFVASEPRLADKVYIPKVYPEYTTKKVLVAEWIDGVRLSDRASIFRLMGEKDPRGGSAGTTSFDTDSRPYTFPQKPLRGGVVSIMDTMVQLFSAQIFEFGWIHCDPHPGNIIIRPHPRAPLYPQLVLLDHGLYVRVSPEFQRQYATLWKGLLTMDFDTIRDVAEQWGIGTPDLFASATLMRPVKFGNHHTSEEFEKMDHYQRSVLIKERLKGFLTDTDKMPKALVFIGRNMRIVQGNNQMFGSPTNRIRITGGWASRSLVENRNLTFRQRIREYNSYLYFKVIMFAIDAAFWYSKLRQWFRVKFGRTSESFEDELERTMREYAKNNLGVEIADNAFDG